MKECTTFEALLKPLSTTLMEETVRKFNADYYSKIFKTWDHLIIMIYAQLYGLNSLRDLEVAFNHQKELKLLMQTHEIYRSTLSDANKRRPANCFLWLTNQLMAFLPRKKRKEVKAIVRKIDSTPIQLKGHGFDEWTAENRVFRCQGLKLHIEYDGQIGMPTKARISSANIDDCSMGQQWPIVSNTIYVFDRGYYDFNWWWSINQKGAYFVTRLKHNVAIKKIKDLKFSHEKVLEDHLIEFKNKAPRGGKRNNYNEPVRRVVITREGKTPLVLVTNLFEIPAEIIGELYKERWGIELFFKWIKQNLKIKKFLGKSENAVKTQLAIALITYLLVGLFKLATKNKLSLHQLLIWIRHYILKRMNYRMIEPFEYVFYSNKYWGEL